MAVSPLARDLEFAHSYHADERPEEAAPRWSSHGNGAEAEIAAGVLIARSTGAGKRHFYSLGKRSKSATESSGVWDMSSGMATVEFRIKCESDSPEDEVFRVQVADGTQLWRASFLPGKCNGKPVITDDWDTYRIVIKDGKMQISTEKSGVIASEVAGAPSTESPSLLFGTFKASQAPSTRSWSLDFIRWTNEKADPAGS